MKCIPGYEGLYKATKCGKIVSMNYLRTGKEKFLKPILHTQGYYTVNLFKNGDKKRYFIHRLIALTYLENPKNKECINHINGIKDDNRVNNLEWSTQKENIRHAIESLGHEYGKTNRKKVSQYSKCGEYIATFESTMEAHRVTGIDRTNISNACNGRYKSAGGYNWKFII